MIQLYPGDILEANAKTHDGRERYPLLVLDTEEALGRATFDTGQQTIIHYHDGDVLRACGRHEDCRANLDLAMACAAQRVASPQVSADREAK